MPTWTTLLALPLAICALVPALLDDAVRPALEMAGAPGFATFAVVTAFGWRAVGVIFLGSVFGLLWGADAAQRRDRQARRERLRAAAIERQRARAYGDSRVEPVDQPRRGFLPLEAFGEGIASAPLLALAFPIAVLVLGLVVAAQ